MRQATPAVGVPGHVILSTCERPKEKAASIALGNLGPVDSRPASRPQSLEIYIISLFTAVVFFLGGLHGRFDRSVIK